MLELRDFRPDWESAWASIVAVHPGATLFHQVDWLRVLQRTQHLGPLNDQIPLEALLEALARWAMQTRLGFVRLLLPPIRHGSAAVDMAANARATSFRSTLTFSTTPSATTDSGGISGTDAAARSRKHGGQTCR
jgi:hypothetical protein